MQLIDTHCHLNFKAFNSDFLEVAQKSADRGIKKIILVGADPLSSTAAIERAREINKILAGFAYVAVGIHPTHTDRIDFSKTEELAKDELTVAIGETGLDFHRDTERESLSAQQNLFRQHIELALRLNKPLIIHNRLADEFIQETMLKFDIKKAVFHCFSSDHNFASWVIDQGFYLSFTGNITYGNKKIKKAIELTPVERIMVETDAPYIVPEPLRAEGVMRCEPYMAEEVIKKIALIKGIDANELSEQAFKNSMEFFGL